MMCFLLLSDIWSLTSRVLFLILFEFLVRMSDTQTFFSFQVFPSLPGLFGLRDPLVVVFGLIRAPI